VTNYVTTRVLPKNRRSLYSWCNKTSDHFWRLQITQLCDVTLGPSVLEQHYTTVGHNFSVMTSAPVNICILLSMLHPYTFLFLTYVTAHCRSSALAQHKHNIVHLKFS